MHIGFISLDHLRDWTGITRLIDSLAAEMIARGHRVTIIACEGTASSKIPISARTYPHELMTIDLDTARGRDAARESIASAGFDICATSIGSKQVIYLLSLFQGSGIPFIVAEPGDPYVLSFDRWQPYERHGMLFCADVFTVLLPQYLPRYPATLQSRATVIGNPAPPPADIDFEARRNKDTQTIMAAGRFNEEDKRFSFLLRAFALLHPDFPSWRLKLVGDGPYWEYYDIMTEQLGIKKLVEFTGSTDDVESHYESADIFCLPSFRAEGLPMVYLEASAYALPLVGYRSCTSSEALIEPNMGALAECDSNGHNTPETLAVALRSLMELTPEERKQRGMAARDTLQEKYGGSIIFDQWEQLLTNTLEKTRASGTTALERVMSMTENTAEIGQEWEGLEPDSPVWTEQVLAGAAREIVTRDDPREAPETSTASEEVESVRLRCELAALQRDYGALEKKYSALLAQFQTVAGKQPSGGKQSGKRQVARKRRK